MRYREVCRFESDRGHHPQCIVCLSLELSGRALGLPQCRGAVYLGNAMQQELISRRLRSLLADYLAGASTLREIENEFGAAYIDFRPDPDAVVQGQRRAMVHGYYAGLNFSDPVDARKFLDVLAAVMADLERKMPRSFIGEIVSAQSEQFDKFREQLTREGYAYNAGAIVPVTAAARLADAKAIALNFDAAHIGQQIDRIEASIDVDPALAIGTAKELVESCFKTICSERGIEYGKDDNLPQLGKRVFKALKLVPDDVPEAAKGAQTIRVLLSNLATVVQGIAEVRGLYGTGHGKDGRVKGISPRHARLAVGAASALVTFVFQTHIEMGAVASEDLQPTTAAS